MGESEGVAVRQASHRDAEFVEFVQARRNTLFRTAYLLSGDSHHAEDLVQTVLARLYSRWERIQRMESVDAYARRAVVNAHVDETRRPWRRERPIPEGHGLPATAAGLSTEDSDELWAALRTLPTGQRRIVVLRHYWGLSVQEIAADLGISPGTVKSQTSAALAHLRKALTIETIRGK